MKLQITEFSGIAPVTPPRYLGANQAQIARNCVSWRGPLRALLGTSQIVALAKAGTNISIYRFGEDVADESLYWFHWDSDVDVVRGFIDGDTSERTLYSGDGEPRVTDNVLALTGAGGEYPYNYLTLGVPEPTVSPSCALQGTPDEGAITEDRVYTYTFVNAWDEESAPYAADPMPPGALVSHQTGQTVNVTLPTSVAGNFDIVSKRIYRSVAGAGTQIYQFVGEVSLATAVFSDDVLADELGEEMPSIDWTAPKATMKGFVALPGGVIAGFDGIDVYFSEPFRPFTFPAKYRQTVGAKVVGLGVSDTTLAVLTQGQPVFMQGSHPENIVLVDADLSQACVSKRSIVSMNGVVYYASPDGLIALSPGGSAVATAALFDKALWQSTFAPESIHGYAYEGRYIGFYDNGVTQGGFIYDPGTRSFVLHSVYADGGYTDLKNDSLYLSISNAVHKFEAGSALTYLWRSKLYTLSTDTAFSCYRVDAEAYPVTLSIYRDGSLHYSISVADNKVYRMPGGKGRDWEIELSGTGEVFAVTVAQTPGEINNG